jgi:hypothetical protein
MMAWLASFFPSFAPTPKPAVTPQTFNTTITLVALLKQQYPAIGSLSYSMRHLKDTIERQNKIRSKLADLIAWTAKLPQPWHHELADAQAAIDQKIRRMNFACIHIGRDEGIQLGWPRIAESYKWLQEVLERMMEGLQTIIDEDMVRRRRSFLSDTTEPTPTVSPQIEPEQIELEQIEPTHTEAPQAKKIKKVAFRKAATAVSFRMDEEPIKMLEKKNVECALGRRDGRKKSKGKYKAKFPPQEEVFQAEYAPMPL